MPENIQTDAQAITLREHLERLIKEVSDQAEKDLSALRRELDLVQGFTKEAGMKADKADEEWRKAANEWRATYADLVRRYATATELAAMEKHLLASDESDRTKAEQVHRSIETRITVLESWKSNMQGRLWGIPTLIGFVVFVVTQLMRIAFPAGK